MTKRTRTRTRKAAPITQEVVLPVLPIKQGRTRPNPELISIESYWAEFQNRSSIHQYEVAEAMDELRIAVAWTQGRLDKVCTKIKEVSS